MMYKKAIWNEFTTWAIAIFLIFVVLLSIGMVLFPQVRAQVFGYASSFLPTERQPDLTARSPVPQQVTQHQQRLIQFFQNPPSGTNCIIDPGALPDLRGYSIALSNDRIQLERRTPGEVSTPYQTTAIQGFRPCVVRNTVATNFHRCLLERNQQACSQSMYENPTEYTIPTSNAAPVLVKIGNNVCFVETFSDGFLGLTSRGCDAPNGRSAIDDDCIADLRRLPTCGTAAAR